MNYLITIALIVVVLYVCTRTEGFTEPFGLSGYTKPVGLIKLDDPKPDLSAYTRIETVIDNDRIETFVQKTNKEIMKRVGVPTYIIETTSIKGYKGEENEIYECMFMVMKKGGFSFGFSVVASFEVRGDMVTLTSLRSQPLGVDAPSRIEPFVSGPEGKAFIDYTLVNMNRSPTRSEFDSAKNNLQY
jgi:hypothetical protein